MIETAPAGGVKHRSGNAEPSERRAVTQLAGVLRAPPGGDRRGLTRARRREQTSEDRNDTSQQCGLPHYDLFRPETRGIERKLPKYASGMQRLYCPYANCNKRFLLSALRVGGDRQRPPPQK